MRETPTIKIDHGIEVPMGHLSLDGKHHALRQTLLGMKVGDSFVWHCNRSPYRAALQLGGHIKIKTRKLNGEGYRVWRIT